MKKFVTILTLLLLFSCNKKESSVELPKEVFRDISFSFSLPKGWKKANNKDMGKSTYKGISIAPKASYFMDNGTILTLSALGEELLADTVELDSFCDGIRTFLQEKGELKENSYSVGNFNVSQFNLKESDKYVYKVIFKTKFTVNTMMDFIVPMDVYDKNTMQSISEIVASVQIVE